MGLGRHFEMGNCTCLEGLIRPSSMQYSCNSLQGERQQQQPSGSYALHPDYVIHTETLQQGDKNFTTTVMSST